VKKDVYFILEVIFRMTSQKINEFREKNYPFYQFHQRFTHAFFVQKSFRQFFSALSLALNELLYKKFVHKMLMKLTPYWSKPAFGLGRLSNGFERL